MRHPEVHHLYLPHLRYTDVRRLDIAVNDAALVGVCEPPAHLFDEIDLLHDGEGFAGRHDIVQIAAWKVLHGDVGPPLGLSQLEDRYDVGVLEASRRLRLPEEAGAQLRVDFQIRGHHLDGDMAIERRIEALVHRPHGPAAQEVHDLVPADLLGHIGTRPEK